MRKYVPTDIEPKWQERWAQAQIYQTNLESASKKPFYLLVEFTYPSGDLHIGHWFAFAVPDILGRFKRMQGYQVFYPNGFDAFGLPAENAAIKRGVHPKDWTYSNIERMKGQFRKMGAIHDWEHTLNSCDPEYYRWNQWIFLKMLERGLAYKGSTLSNWCPNCQTVLANENVEAGLCWRCGTEVIQKEVSQWFFKITEYADRLIWDNPPVVDWPKSVIDGQNNWIGKSEGVELEFRIKNNEERIGSSPELTEKDSVSIKVYTTRPDTLFGVSFIVINPEHSLLKELVTSEKAAEVEQYIKNSAKKSELERKESKDKTGVFTGAVAINPLSGEEVPVWVADYVLPGYGTGAVMGVPAHDARDFAFASKFNLSIRTVIARPRSGEAISKPEIAASPMAPRNDEVEIYEGEGSLVDSGEYTGLSSSEAREKISKYIEENNIGTTKIIYHLHDWSVSRQRYWGTPIPIIYCRKCWENSKVKGQNSKVETTIIDGQEYAAIPVPEKELPVELPYEVEYSPKGKPPLATAEAWVNTKCPVCGSDAVRETETMDTFVDSSWYFFRYLDPKNESQSFGSEVVKTWMPLDIYFGGAEHTLGHTLYSRFFTLFFKDLGLIDFDEYAKKRVHHGVILGPDGSRMSKSRGNVVNPDEQVQSYGADAVRLYLAFLGPYDLVAPWKPEGIHGVYHFLERVWNLYDKVQDSELSGEDLKMMHKVIKKVGLDIGSIKFNTAVAALMEWLNYLSRKPQVAKEEYQTFLILLAPFAPHITDELWEMMDEKSKVKSQKSKDHWSVHQEAWPQFDPKYLESDEVLVAVQVNGKVRDMLLISTDILNDESEVVKRALESAKIQKYTEGRTPSRQIYIPGKVLNLVFSS